jgi:hypothetical protein
MVVVGLPYAFQGQMGVDEIKGGSPYGASTITGADGSRMPSAVELEADCCFERIQAPHIRFGGDAALQPEREHAPLIEASFDETSIH